MRLLHTADSHLGFQAYNALTGDGTNQREADVYDAFRQVVDHAIDQEVDLFLHAGDLFDSVRPTNRAIGEAIDQLLRLRDAGIPVVVVGGNHETPKMAETGHVLDLLAYFDGIQAIRGGQLETVEVDDLTVHAVPHVHTQDAFDDQLDDLDVGAGTNVLALHGTAPGIEGLPTGEFNDLTLRPGAFEGFDYVALGHYHVQTRVDDHVWYAGSPERMTFAEADVEKACLVVDLDAGDVESLPLDVRPMVEATVDCTGLGKADVAGQVEKILDQDLAGALVKVKLSDLREDVHQRLELDPLLERADEAMHAEIQPDVVRDEASGGEGGAGFASLADEFESYLGGVPVEDLDKERLAGMARDYLTEARDAPS